MVKSPTVASAALALKGKAEIAKTAAAARDNIFFCGFTEKDLL